jgi:4-hydroxythreonine-4-phosphate dehydrogenase
MKFLPTVGVTLGCPCGVGAEVVARALANGALRRRARWVLFGARSSWEAALALTGTRLDAGGEISLVASPEPRGGFKPGKPDERADASTASSLLAALKAAGDLGLHAVATAPARKQAFVLLPGGPFPGHTELFHHVLGTTPVPVMIFVAPGLRLALHTIHVPLRRVPALCTRPRLLRTLRVLHQGLALDLGVRAPVVDVLGLNPHASEGGLLGREDPQEVAPAIAQAVAEGMAVRGPFPADGYFAGYAGHASPPSAVLALYHDQGLAPFKLWEKRRGCQMTLGLRVPRTSCDHGTAYDVAGRGVADGRSMAASMVLAVQVARRRMGGR